MSELILSSSVCLKFALAGQWSQISYSNTERIKNSRRQGEDEMVKLFSRTGFLEVSLRKMENSFSFLLNNSMQDVYRTVSRKNTNFNSPTPLSAKLPGELSEHSSLPESQRDNTRG